MPQPPKKALQFLRWFCADRFLEEIEGDLYEWYEELVEEQGTKQANRAFYWATLSYVRRYFFRKRNWLPKINTSMYRNFITLAIRYFYRKKTHTLINIFGLAIGIAACLLILQYVSFEMSFDQFHENRADIYRVINHRYKEGTLIQKGTITYPKVGETMRDEFPEIISNTHIMPYGSNFVRTGEDLYESDYAFFADSAFLNLFSFPILSGDPETALVNDHAAVISRSLAEKLFGRQSDYSSLVGKTFLLNQDQDPFEVKAILEDIPDNSLLQFDLLLSFETLIRATNGNASTSWQWSDFHHFLQLRPGTDYKVLEAKFDDYSDRYFKGTEVTGSEEKFSLQPLEDAHLYSDLEYEIGQTTHGRTVHTLWIVAGLILLIAWLNYINLSTAQAMERAKEVGVRKVLGSTKGQLVSQFFIESILMNLIGLSLAILIVESSRTFFSNLLDTPLSWEYILGQGFGGLSFPMIFLGIFILGIFLSGAYPALVLSSHKMMTILKGQFKTSKNGNRTQKVILVFQFMISLVFIAGTIFVYQQIQYLRNKDLGISIDETLVIQGPSLTNFDSVYVERLYSFKKELLNHSYIKSVTNSSRLPGDRLGRDFNIQLEGDPTETTYMASLLGVDHHFIEDYQLQLLSGRSFRPEDHNLDPQKLDKMVINQSFSQALGFQSPEEAISKRLKLWGGSWEIIGVVNDFHQETLRNRIEPLFFFPVYSTGGYFSLKIDPANSKDAIAAAEMAFSTFFPGNAFQHFFMEEHYQRHYRSEFSFSQLLGFFALLAIVIACLGLFGLISYSAVLRTKEMGIRKILGASFSQLFLLLTKEFALLIGIAFLLAIPLAWYSMSQWIDQFAYHTDIHWWVFAFAGMLCLTIAFLSVVYQVTKAALNNPVDSLRYE